MHYSIKRVSNERIAANREQLWTAASKGWAMKGLQLIASNYELQHQKVNNERIPANLEQLWTTALKGWAMKGLQLIASSYGLQYQRSEQWRVAAKQNHEQLWTAASKGWAMKGLQLIMSRIKQRSRETNLIASLRAPMKVQTGKGKYQFSLIKSHMIL